MKKSLISFALVLCLIFSMSVCAFAEGANGGEQQYLELSGRMNNKIQPAWWCNETNYLPGFFAFAFTSPSNFNGIDLALYCGTGGAPVIITLIQYVDSLEDSVYDGLRIWTGTETIVGDHVGTAGQPYPTFEFDKVVPAGRYAVLVEYGAEEVEDGKYFVVGSADCSENEDFEIEIYFEGFQSSVGGLDVVPNARLLITDAEADPLPTPTPTAEPTATPTAAPETEAPVTEAPATPTYNPPEEDDDSTGSGNSADNEVKPGGCGSVIGGGAVVFAVMAAAAFVFRKRS